MEEAAGKERIEPILETVAEGIIIISIDGHITYVNTSAERILGVKRASIIGRRHDDAGWKTATDEGAPFPEDELPFAQVVEESEPVRDIKLSVERPDGTRIFLSCNATPLRNREGALMGAVISLSDISEWKRVEEELGNALEESQQRSRESAKLNESFRAILRYRKFEDSARIIFDSCKNLIGATSGYIALLNSDGTQNEVVFLESGGLSCTVDPSLPMPVRGLRAEVYRTGKTSYHNDFSNSEWVDLLPEGHVGLDNVLFAPLVVDRKAVGLMGIANKPGGFTDEDAEMASSFGELAAVALQNSRTLEESERLLEQVEHERQRAEELATILEKERDTLQVIMENTDAHLAYLDTDLNFVEVNSTYARGSGHTKEELIGRNHFELFPNEENQAVFERVRDTGEPIEFKAKPFEFADQPWRGVTYWDWSLTPIKDAYGEVQGLAFSLVDVTASTRAKELGDALNSVNATLHSTLDFDEIVQRVVVEAAKAIGCETSTLDIREGDYWVVRYAYKFPEETIGQPFSDDEAPFATQAADTKRLVVIDDAFNDDRVDREMQKKYNVRSAMVVPLIVKEEAIGALFFNYHSAAVTFNDAQIDFANKVGASISLALENARLYAVERSIADTLQEALLTVPEHIPGIDFGYLYRSATEIAKVGGDFYDLFELEDGRVGIAVGDISGKGLEAATLTSLVKNAIKAYAYQEESPASIMAKTNDVVRRTSPQDFVTVFFAILDTRSGVLKYCSAGHPPAILRRKTSETFPLLARSPVIGAFAGLKYVDDETILEKGDTLVLYTDGVTEAKCEGDLFGEERLVSFVRKLKPGPAREIPGRIFGKVMDCTDGKLSDDVALLVISLV
ncbi:MAG: SpoIIE family protein phosphatase [Actinobacteria bacterium]|nr:SpoIIE family protein phosphatase [Actinomycetota bacterium]